MIKTIGCLICINPACALRQVKAAISKLRKKWMGPNYELLTNNCLHFCDELAEALQVPKIPGADAVLIFVLAVSKHMNKGF